MLRHSLLATPLVLCLLASAVSVAAERPLSEPPAGPAFRQQEPAAITFQGEEGFVVWTDWRAGATPAAYGSRINTTGTLLDPRGIRLNTDRRAARAQGVVGAGGTWVVVWVENHVVHGRRIGSDGALLGPAVALLPLAVQSEPHVIDVASAGPTIVVAPRAVDPGLPVTEPQMAIADFGLTAVRTLSSPGLSPRAVISDGSDYFIFGATPVPGHPTRIAKMSADGQIGPLAPAGFIGALTDVTWTGHDFMVSADGFLYRVPHDLSSVGPPISAYATGHLQALAGSASHAVAVWSDDDRIYAAVVGAQIADAPVILGRSAAASPFVPVRVGVMQHGYMVAAAGLRTATVPFDLILPAPEPLSDAGEQTRSLAAQSRFAAVRDGSSDLYAFVEADGVSSRVMIGSPRWAARPIHESVEPQYSPAIASDGTNALVTWLEEQPGSPAPHVMALLVDAEGRSLVWGAAPLGFATPSTADDIWSGRDVGGWPASVVWTGSMFLVAWDGKIVRVLPSGTPLDSPPRDLFPPTIARRDAMSMARFGDRVLLVWMEGNWDRQCLVACLPSSIRAASLTSNGDLVNATPIEVASDRDAALPQIAVNGDTALVVWEEGGIRGRRIGLDGSLSPAVTLAAVPAMRPAIARHLDGFVVSWQTNVPGIDAVQAVTVSPDLAAGAPRTLVTDSVPTQGPHAWTTAGGSAEVAYLRVGSQTDWVPRVYISTWPPPGRARVRAVGR
ncbi:MAG TPA: hypothetical protein VNA04_14445 [Thermoanaerobaculia bacterium]|nr:hypothetical protein [Thermoanaerobaculia bacterium]